MGLGSWLRKAADGVGDVVKGVTDVTFRGKVPKPLQGLLGESYLDELGTGAGFMVGGPAGAGIGRAAGHALAKPSEHANIGSALKHGLTGAAMGAGASALGASGGSMSIPGLGGIGGGSGGLGGALRGVTGGLRDFGNWATSSPERTALVTSGLGTAAGAYGAHQADRAANADAEFARGRQTMMDPQRQELMRLFMQRLGGGDAAPAGA